MFCTNCGAAIHEGDAFCTACGAKAPTEDATAAPAAPATAPTSALPTVAGASAASASASMPSGSDQTRQPAPKRRSIGLVAGLAAAAVAAIAVGVIGAMVALGAGPFSEEASSEAAPSAESESGGAGSGEVVVQATPNDAGADTQSASSAAESSATSDGFATAPAVDFNDPADYAAVNLFLSNFTEVGYGNFSGFTNDDPDPGQTMSFALWHTIINAESAVERHSKGADFPAIQTNGLPLANRIPFDTLNQAANDFLKTGLNPNDYLSQEPLYRDGYVYFYQGTAIWPMGVAVSDSITRIAEDQYQVSFSVYAPTNSNYDATDQSLYGLSADEVKARFGVDAPRARGTAVVSPDPGNSIAPFTLISYETTEASSGAS